MRSLETGPRHGLSTPSKNPIHPLIAVSTYPQCLASQEPRAGAGAGQSGARAQRLDADPSMKRHHRLMPTHIRRSKLTAAQRRGTTHLYAGAEAQLSCTQYYSFIHHIRRVLCPQPITTS